MFKISWIEKLSFIFFSISLAFGVFNPFSNNSEDINGLSYYATIILILAGAVIRPTQIISFIIKSNIKYLLLFFIFFTTSTLIYGNAHFSNKPIINIKLLANLVLFFYLVFYFTNDYKLLINSLFIYTITTIGLMSLWYIGIFDNVSFVSKGRLTLFGDNANSISTRVAIAAIFIPYFVYKNPLWFKKWRYTLLVFLPILLLFVIKSGSRGTFISLIFSLLVMLYYSNISSYWKISIFGLLATFSILIFPYMQQQEVIMSRMQETLAEGDIGGRVSIWVDSLTIFMQNPLFGVGENGFIDEMYIQFRYYKDTHNLFIYLLASGGIISFILYLNFILKILRANLLALQKNDSMPFVISIFILLVAAKTGGAITYIILYYLLAWSYSLSIHNINQRIIN